MPSSLCPEGQKRTAGRWDRPGPRHCAIRRSQIMGFNRWEEGLCVSASRKVLTKEKSPVTVKLGCRRLGTWPCHSSFRSEVALQGAAAHPAGGRRARRPRSRSDAAAAEPGSRRSLSPLHPKSESAQPPLGRPVRRAGEGLRPRPGKTGGGGEPRPRPGPVHTPGAVAPGNLRSSRSRWDPGGADARWPRVPGLGHGGRWQALLNLHPIASYQLCCCF
ncbi:translation initiation factor IF-2-like [Prionailurus viverrinus]|uniref:translation initiation factor IF-2-like n=1 Tax=Prionailurus viverrinus TaxID=61388 RepID=UPI001FF2B26A|nr:translation initiation factor IF-2-like [Prionailurus viverrinus]